MFRLLTLIDDCTEKSIAIRVACSFKLRKYSNR